MAQNFNIPSSPEWREEYLALLNFGAKSKVTSGFGYLGENGEILPEFGAQLWINCRMTHMFSLAAIQGCSEAKELACHGVNALLQYFADPQYGGWFSRITNMLDSAGKGVSTGSEGERKEGYAHAFVLLAGASAKIAQIPRGAELFAAAAANQNQYWWEETAGRVRESWNRDWSVTEDYRGANANMHTVEAYLAAWDACGETIWLERAAKIASSLINISAREHNWYLPEHYRADWTVDLGYNKDRPADPFRPWGATPGHGFEWARLCVNLFAAARAANLGLALDWVTEAARKLYDTAYQAWDCDGAPGFVYTTDFSGSPVYSQRMHWVVCEALGASLTLAKFYQDTDPDFASRCRQRCAELENYLRNMVIMKPGAWQHELNPQNKPDAKTWVGKPDIYHAGQALLLPDLPLTPTFAKALRELV